MREKSTPELILEQLSKEFVLGSTRMSDRGELPFLTEEEFVRFGRIYVDGKRNGIYPTLTNFWERNRWLLDRDREGKIKCEKWITTIFTPDGEVHQNEKDSRITDGSDYVLNDVTYEVDSSSVVSKLIAGTMFHSQSVFLKRED